MPKKTLAPVQVALDWLEANATEHDRKNMAKFGIVAKQSFGVSMAKMKQLARQLGTDHALAAGLWATGIYEARMVASMIDDPAQVTSAQMDRWCNDFDNWAICDTACFFLFDRSPHAFRKVARWARHRDEFPRRGAFALLACLALHKDDADDGAFLDCLPLVEAAATDERNFIRKALLWALRGIGERSRALNAATHDLAGRLVATGAPTPRWIGTNTLRELAKPAALKRLARNSS